jgi:hypothetical protein
VSFKVEKRASPTVTSTQVSSNIGGSSPATQGLSAFGYAYSITANQSGAGNVAITYTAASEL